MKTIAFYLLTIAIAVAFSSCDVWEHQVVPSSTVSTQEFSFTDYETISASHAFQVYLSFSDSEESIEIEANENLHQYIEVVKDNNTLSIGIRDDIRVTGSPTLRARITTRRISDFYGSGSTKFQLSDPALCENTSIRLSGASTFSGEVEADELFVELSGASSANLSGNTSRLDAELTGASSIKDYNFITAFLKADLSGASSAYLSVEQEIDVTASGASSLQYKGAPVIVNQDLSGSSSVRKVN